MLVCLLTGLGCDAVIRVNVSSSSSYKDVVNMTSIEGQHCGVNGGQE